MAFCFDLHLQHTNALAGRRTTGLLVGPFRLERGKLPFTHSLQASSARSDVNPLTQALARLEMRHQPLRNGHAFAGAGVATDAGSAVNN